MKIKVTKRKGDFYIQINDKGGTHFRKYTKDTLRMLYDVSPTAANFELMVLIEGAVFITLRIYYMLRKEEKKYDGILAEKKDFNWAIDRIFKLKIIDGGLHQKLHEYREARNKMAHDLFRIKNPSELPEFKNYSYTEELENLFKKGMEAIIEISEIIVPQPGESGKKEYFKKFGINLK